MLDLRCHSCGFEPVICNFVRSRWLYSLAFGILAIVAITLFHFFRNSRTEPKPGMDKPLTSSHFRDMSVEVGLNFHTGHPGSNLKINLYDHGCGLAVADFDGDGFDDIYFVNPIGPNALYKNNGDGTFTEVTAKAGVALGDRICVGACFGDYDNDGFPDLYVTSIRGGNVLFRNQGDGTFKEVTKQAGLPWIGHSQSAVFFDYDNDGFLDLLVTNMAKWTSADPAPGGRVFAGVDDFWQLFAAPREYNVLFHNNGNGTFTDVTTRAGIKGQGWGGDVAVFDYDLDGQPDVFVTNMFGRNQLFHNDGSGRFTDVTQTVLGRTSFGAIGCKAFDFNNDGQLDLFVVDMHSDMWVTYVDAPAESLAATEKTKFPNLSGPVELAKYQGVFGKQLEKNLADKLQLRYEEVLFGNTLFKNLGGGKFAEVSDQAGVETFWPWGIAVGDFNNDGFEDIFVPSGMGQDYPYWPNRLLMNNGDETFAERSREEGIEPPRDGLYLSTEVRTPRSSRCAAVADFGNRGRLDIVVNNFNAHPYFFQNNFPKKNYIGFQLRGTKSNRDALGALVWVHMGKEVMLRQVQGGGGYLSQSSRKLHFGLGVRPKVDRVEIRWPSGKRQEITDPSINQLHQIVEPD